jgi:hypothetical protein
LTNLLIFYIILFGLSIDVVFILYFMLGGGKNDINA